MEKAGISESKIKHLEMIQAVISRMSNNSSNAKRYCLVIVAGGVALFSNFSNLGILVGVLLIIVVFWLVNSRYHQQEKWFRGLFEIVRLNKNEPTDFDMTPGRGVRENIAFRSSALNWSTAGVYLPLLSVIILAWFLR